MEGALGDAAAIDAAFADLDATEGGFGEAAFTDGTFTDVAGLARGVASRAGIGDFTAERFETAGLARTEATGVAARDAAFSEIALSEGARDGLTDFTEGDFAKS